MSKKIIILGCIYIAASVTLFSFFLFHRTTTIVRLPTEKKQKPLSPFSPPTIPMIFSDNHAWTATLSADHIRILTATGDIIPARSVNTRVLRYNPLWPYEKVAPTFKQWKTDITFINLETPLLTNCQPTDEGMIFCGTYRNVKGLKYISVTIANLANNHAGNHGDAGVNETNQFLQNNGIMTTGVNGPVYKNVRGVRFAFLGFNDITKTQPGIENVDEATMKKEIQDAKNHADIVIVTFHWGVEYKDQPDDRQRFLGHLAIDDGADLIIGNHPHWIQPVELYNGKYITYAHGNFIFDQMWSQKTREGVIGRYTFYDKQLVDIQFFPLQIDDYGQPHFVENLQKHTILSDMQTQSVIIAKNRENLVLKNSKTKVDGY